MKEFAPLEDVESVLPILSKISFLGGVRDTQQDTIFRRFETVRFKKGEYVARQGEEASHIYIIKSGRVELRITVDGEMVRKREFGVGDSFGEAAMLSLVNNTASFVSAEDSELITISRTALNQLRREDPELFCQLILNLARDLARKLQFTDEMLLRCNLKEGSSVSRGHQAEG